jgi:hypothetical protein
MFAERLGEALAGLNPLLQIYDYRLELFFIYLLAYRLQRIGQTYPGLYHYGKLIREIQYVLSAGAEFHAEVRYLFQKSLFGTSIRVRNYLCAKSPGPGAAVRRLLLRIYKCLF